MRWYWLILCILLALGSVAGGWFLNAQSADRPEAIREKCIHRLTVLGHALEKYIRENDGEMPVAVTDLYPGYVNDLKVCERPRRRGSVSPREYGYDSRATADTGFSSLVVYDPPGGHEEIASGSHAALMRNGAFVGVKTLSGDEIRMLLAVQDHGFDYARNESQDALEGLLDIMSRSEGIVRSSAEEVMRLATKPQTTKLLVAELGREEVQDEAATVLAGIGTKAVQELARACEDPDPVVRAGAVRSLSGIGDVSAVPTILSKLSDPDPVVRIAAAESLGKIDPKSAVSALTEALRDESPETQEMVVAAIPHIGTSLLPELERRLQQGDTGSREVAAFILGKLKSEAAVPALGRATADPEWSVAWYAALSLAEIGTDECAEHLITLLERPLSTPGAVDLHAVAANGLGTIGGDKVRRKLREVLMREGEPHNVRRACAYHLGELKDRSAVPLLIETMRKFYYLRPVAGEALEKITGRDFGARPNLWQAWWDSSPQPPPLYETLVR